MANIRNAYYIIFLLVFLVSISKSYGLNTEEEVNLNKETHQLKMLNVQEKEPVENVDEADLLKKISLDIKGMDIMDVLKILSSEGNLNIVIGKNVSGRVSMFLRDVDVWDAFEIIIAANGLAYEKNGSIIKVMNARDYELIHGRKYGDRRVFKTRKLKYVGAKDVSVALNQVKTTLGRVIVDEASNTLILLDVPEQILAMEKIIQETDLPIEPLSTRVFELNYADSDKLKEQLQEIVTKDKGIVRVDVRTNKVIVMDYPSKIAQIEQMISAFDEKTRQVLIEAKIIEVTLTDSYKMGIDWQYIASKQLNFTAFNINRILNTQGAQIIAGAVDPTSTGDFRVIMDMLKTFGDTKTLSTPRITAISGQEAKILVGSKEVYVESTSVQGQTSTETAESVKFVDVGVKLYVTPTINRDGFITMKIRPEVSSVSGTFTKQDGTTIPIVSTSEAETSVIVKDGVTIVMGGLMKNEHTKNIYKLPLLGDIPFLGALFRRKEDTTTKTELVIFLTPHIISGAERLLETKS